MGSFRRATGCAATIVEAREVFSAALEAISFLTILFRKKWWGWKGQSPFLAFRRKRNPTPLRLGRNPKTGKGGPRMSPRPQFQRNCGMTQFLIFRSEKPRQRVEAFLRFFSLTRFLFVDAFLQDCVLRGTP